MPHGDPEVIRAAKAAGAWCLPGVSTPTEGFAALKAGADGLKLFPGEALPPAVLKAWKPCSRPMCHAAGRRHRPETMAAYVAARGGRLWDWLGLVQAGGSTRRN
jgi:2-dehydro-3-deoxyphosphogalactonate aldolase